MIRQVDRVWVICGFSSHGFFFIFYFSSVLVLEQLTEEGKAGRTGWRKEDMKDENATRL